MEEGANWSFEVGAGEQTMTWHVGILVGEDVTSSGPIEAGT